MITAIRNSKDTAVKRMFNDWLSAKSFLARQYSLPATKRVPDIHSVEARTEKIEKELSRLSVNFQNQQLAGSVLVKDVQKKLKEDEAMIEFLSFHLINGLTVLYMPLMSCEKMNNSRYSFLYVRKNKSNNSSTVRVQLRQAWSIIFIVA